MKVNSRKTLEKSGVFEAENGDGAETQIPSGAAAFAARTQNGEPLCLIAPSKLWIAWSVCGIMFQHRKPNPQFWRNAATSLGLQMVIEGVMASRCCCRNEKPDIFLTRDLPLFFQKIWLGYSGDCGGNHGFGHFHFSRHRSKIFIFRPAPVNFPDPRNSRYDCGFVFWLPYL